MGIPTAIHSTSNAISPQQERTKPSGPRPCRYGAKFPPQRELTYQEMCYVVIQAKGLSFSTMLGKISWVCPKGAATSLPARMETQTWAILTAVSSGTS